MNYKYNNTYYREKELEGPISRVISPYLGLKMVVDGNTVDMPLLSKEFFLKNHGNLFGQLRINYEAAAYDLSTTYNLCVSPIVISKCKSLKDVASYIIFLKDNNIKKRRLC